MALGCHGIDVMHGYQTDLTDKQLQVIKNMPGLQKNQKIYIVKTCVMWRMPAERRIVGCISLGLKLQGTDH